MDHDREAERSDSQSLTCPSAPPEWEGAQLLGVVGGSVTEPEVDFVEPRPVSQEILDLSGPVEPTEIFRFSAPCQESACQHFRNGKCGVGQAAVDHGLATEKAALPSCTIRKTCRWWHEQGPAACRACRFVVTDDPARPERFAAALKTPLRDPAEVLSTE